MAQWFDRLIHRFELVVSRTQCWIRLRRCVRGRLKLRGDTRGIRVDRSFRCDGDLWLGVHSDEGTIVIESGVSASGPLVITAVRPLRIGAGSLFGPNVLVTDHYHGNSRDPSHRALSPSARPLHSPGQIEIGKDVQLGANCVVLAPSAIGDLAIIGANTVVKGRVAPKSIYTGSRDASTSRGHAVVKEFKD
jgi:acetyltransferase-like isoleucine patch superfamily enzyme